MAVSDGFGFAHGELNRKFDALELGPLRRDEVELPEELRAKIEAVRPEKLPAEAIYTLIACYAVNRPEDSD